MECMLEAEDFQLPLEKNLRLRVIQDEIKHCDDIGIMRELCMTMAEQNMTFQHMLSKLLLAELEGDIKHMLESQEKKER